MPLSLSLQPNSASLAPGTYSATISIANSPQTVSVTYALGHSASIVLGPPTAAFSTQQCAAAPARQSISITNGGDVPLTDLSLGTISYSAGASNWLYARLVAGAAPSFLILEPSITGPVLLPVGDYTATVPVTSSVAGVAPASVTVTFHLAPRAP